ncbi:unnamed protein product [Cladocopium goreaui]|uniref:Uncharacterized protein n=1 Tax=Cladocopium goreaui TaxID=2562237 RepID=A0A9P1M677_9DINO|nr:unnamed protein product [Cladocopium goreaui]
MTHLVKQAEKKKKKIGYLNQLEVQKGMLKFRDFDAEYFKEKDRILLQMEKILIYLKVETMENLVVQKMKKMNLLWWENHLNKGINATSDLPWTKSVILMNGVKPIMVSQQLMILAQVGLRRGQGHEKVLMVKNILLQQKQCRNLWQEMWKGGAPDALDDYRWDLLMQGIGPEHLVVLNCNNLANFIHIEADPMEQRRLQRLLRLEAQDMKKVKKKKMRIQTIPLNLEIEMTKTMVMMEEKVMEVAEAMTTTMWPMDIVDALMAALAALVALVEVVNTLEESLDVFISSPEGCKRGIDCRYCHFEHPVVQLEHRIRKSMRDRIKRRLEPLCFKDADLEAIHDDLQKEAAKHPLARIRIQAYLRTRGRTSCAHTGPSQGDFNAQPGQSQQYQLQYQ